MMMLTWKMMKKNMMRMKMSESQTEISTGAINDTFSFEYVCNMTQLLGVVCEADTVGLLGPSCA